jgi:hypothetical protein
MRRGRRQLSWWDGFDLPDRDNEERSPDLEEMEETPMVEWDPIRCPDCGSKRKTTYGVSRHKPVRYHRCLSCRRLYRSIERRGDDI